MNFTKWKSLVEMTCWSMSSFIFFILYPFISNLAAARGIDYRSTLHTTIDNWIPFTTFFLLFYVLDFFIPTICWICIIIKQKNKKTLREISISLLLLMSSTYLLNYLFPAYTHAEYYQTTLSHSFLYSIWLFLCQNMPLWNSFPSLHAAIGWLSYRHYRQYVKKYTAVYFFWLIGMLIGTVTLKFHEILDVFAGVLLAEIIYQLMRNQNVIQALLRSREKVESFSQDS